MGIDLALCPISYASPSNKWWLAFNRLGFDRDYELFDLVKQLPTQPLSEAVTFDWSDDEGVEERKKDQYGTPLTYCNAGQFRKIDASNHEGWNYAVLMLLQALPPSTPVVLWWH